ncbi:actin-domain-containing protein [Infundibulicybe gibba]|nr:actin-domain-containing protein [Infundibulicybe gibba]
MASPTTPRGATKFAPTTPANSRVAASNSNVHASPHYTTTRRHSLYGVEDRIIIDPGSQIWKVGFSGEGRPRDVFFVGGKEGKPLWGLRRATDPIERAEEDKLLEMRLQRCLRSVFHQSLLTDPKARKVILVEHPLLPIYVKDIIARILFENQVPSVSFASSHLLSLLAVGRITGLVLDCGHLESIALPLFAARPLYPHLRTTPLAGSRLTSHLRALLLLFGTYLPPPSTLGAVSSIPAANRSTRVPQEVLTNDVVEAIKTRCCFVGEVLGTTADSRGDTPAGDEGDELDIPPSDSAFSESDSQAGRESNVSSQPESSEFSVKVTCKHWLPVHPSFDSHRATNARQAATSQQTGTGRGTLIIPGWIRERAAEVLFEGGDVDESSVAEVILDALLKVPVDLRKTLASSILVTGGTVMLPGFIPRLHNELIRAIGTPPVPPRHQVRPDRPSPPSYDRYAPLRPLLHYFSILNNPAPPPPRTERAKANAGKAPAFSPATIAWVGGSLAGALKTGGAEIAREKWDEADPDRDADESMDMSPDFSVRARTLLPDWTRVPLPSGAPPANQSIPPQTPVGA